MKIGDIIQKLENFAPPAFQEAYDNSGLLTGNPDWDCTGVLCTLDATEAVILEAREKGCNLVVSHHPIIFKGLKKITGNGYVEKSVIAAIRQDIAVYSIHTNLDNVLTGVNSRIADLLGLQERKILLPLKGKLFKLHTFIPEAYAEKVRTALFEAGAGQIGNYTECSFSVAGTGTYLAGAAARPFAGTAGIRHREPELRVEMIFPEYLQSSILAALIKTHPYEEVAYDLVPLNNDHPVAGSGLIGELPEAEPETTFLGRVKDLFQLKVIRHSPLLGKNIKRVAVCGGAGSFLTDRARSLHADIFLTADIRYHEFFDANNQLVMADIGHWESERATIGLLSDILVREFPTFAILKTEIISNPVNYFL